MVDFEGPDFWMRRLGQIMVNSGLSYLSIGLDSNDQKQFADAIRRRPQTTIFENVLRSRSRGHFRKIIFYRLELTEIMGFWLHRAFTKTQKQSNVFEFPDPSRPGAFWPFEYFVFPQLLQRTHGFGLFLQPGHEKT